MKTKVVKKKKVSQKPSLFDYHVTAAVIAAKMGISLSHAFDRYVKPYMPKGPIKAIRPDQYSAVWGRDG